MNTVNTPSAQTIAASVQAGQSATIEVSAALDRAEADTLNAIIRVHRTSALKAAAAIDARIAAGETLPMAGVPLVIKDNMCFENHETTACSKILTGFKPPYMATALQQMLDAGAVIVATANMDEFAMGSSNETSVYGPVSHPLDADRIPGGSSGGSAAAVAARITPISLGSDTGGSIRQPASLCGCVGMKPTYGSVSRYGLMAFGSSLDQIGPMANTIADAALCLDSLVGHDKNDSTSVERSYETGHAATIAKTDLSYLAGKRIGYIEHHSELLSEEMRNHLDGIKQKLADAGAELVPVSLAHEKYATAIYYIIGTGEASSNLSRYDGVHYGHRSEDATDLNSVYNKSRAEGFGPEVQRRIMLGTYVLSAGYFDAYYKKAMRVRRLICEDYDKAFQNCDAIIGLASPTTAFKRGEKTDDPLTMYLSDIFTIAANLSGVPCLSVPSGKDKSGLPIGIHLQTPHWKEKDLLSFARCVELIRE